MSEQDEKPKVIMQRGNETEEWPLDVKRAFIGLTFLAHAHEFSVLCAVGLNHKERRLSVFFSPSASENPEIAAMCEDIAYTFTMMAKRLKQ